MQVPQMMDDAIKQNPELFKRVYTAKKLADLLSNREKQVAAGLSYGLQNKEIARILEISPRTVEIHKARIFYKWHIQTGTAAVRIAVYAGIDMMFEKLFNRKHDILEDNAILAAN